MNDKLFNEPMTLFQQNINDIMKENPSKDLIEDLIRLNMFKNAEKDDKQLVLVELYNLLGTEQFMDVMDLLAGKTIKFPKKEDFRETIEIALSYYYRQFKDCSWSDIKDMIKDDAISPVRLRLKVQQLQKFIDYFGELRFSKLKKEGEENGES